MPRALDQQIPYAKNWKTCFDQRQQFLVKNQKLAQRKPAEGAEFKDRTGRSEASTLQLKNEEALAFQLRSNDGLLVAFDLPLESRSVGARYSIREDSHRSV
jgi:hypothetical protein